MELHAAFIYFLLLANLNSACAKIAGGPRGRFDKHPPKKTNYHVSARHTHYAYHPPAYIHYICRYCSSVGRYPVYHGLPPTYVFKYRESGTRFGILLTGLALYNLGRAQEYWMRSPYYTQLDDEHCSMQVIDREHFEETTFPCFMMSSFLERAVVKDAEAQTFDVTSAQVNVKQYLQAPAASIEITRAHECVIWRNTTAERERVNIPCALLREYGDTMKPAGVPVYIWMPTCIGIVIAIMVCFHTSCRKQIVYKEELATPQSTAEGYLITFN